VKDEPINEDITRTKSPPRLTRLNSPPLNTVELKTSPTRIPEAKTSPSLTETNYIYTRPVLTRSNPEQQVLHLPKISPDLSQPVAGSHKFSHLSSVPPTSPRFADSSKSAEHLHKQRIQAQGKLDLDFYEFDIHD